MQPAAAQVAIDPISDASGIAEFECSDLDAAGAACTLAPGVASDFCVALDAEGEPLANSTGFTDDGLVLFQNIDVMEIAAIRCRDL
jgi:hypothetical protein